MKKSFSLSGKFSLTHLTMSMTLALFLILLAGCTDQSEVKGEHVTSPSSSKLSLNEVIASSDGIFIGRIEGVSEGYIARMKNDNDDIIVETDASVKVERWLYNPLKFPDRIVITMPEGTSKGKFKTYVSDQKRSLFPKERVLILFKKGSFDGTHIKFIPTDYQGIYYFKDDKKLAKLDPETKPAAKLAEIEKLVNEFVEQKTKKK